MKQMIASIVMLIMMSVSAFSEGPVLKVRIMKQRICLIGKDCQPIEQACGSAVVVDTARTKAGAKGYALLTAAHVVSSEDKPKPGGGRSWFMYPTDCWIEVLIGGEWKQARLVTYSKNADLALLTVGSSATVEVACLGQGRPKKGEQVTAKGWTQCTNLDTYTATVDIWDEGPNCADSFKGATGPVVSGQSGGAVLDQKGDLVGIITAHDSTNNRIGIYTNHPEICRFMKAAWDPDLGPKPEIDSKAPSIAPEATGPKDVPKVIPTPLEPPEAKPSDLGGIWGGVDKEPAPLPKKEPKDLLPSPPKLPDLPEIIGGMKGKTPVADAITKAEPFFKLGSLALTGLQLAGIAVPGVGLPVAAGIAVLRLWARNRKAHVENGNGSPSTGWGPGDGRNGPAPPRDPSWPASPPPPPKVTTGPPEKMPDWLKDWTSQIVSPPLSPVPHHCPPPTVVTVESPPTPTVVVSETRYAPYEKDTVSEALNYAKREIVNKYPGAVPTLETLEGLMEQFLAAKGIKYPKKTGE